MTSRVTVSPAHGHSYTVAANDSLTTIAEAEYGVSRYETIQVNAVIQALKATNSLVNANLILPGQTFVLPDITIPEADARVAPGVVVKKAVAATTEVYILGTATFVDDPKIVAQVFHVPDPMAWHIDRNRDMHCPVHMPDDGADWDVERIMLNPFSIMPHGFGNYDVRGLRENAGTQCIYTSSGELITDERAGTRDLSPPVDPVTGEYTLGRIWDHTWADVIPEMLVSSAQPGFDE